MSKFNLNYNKNKLNLHRQLSSQSDYESDDESNIKYTKCLKCNNKLISKEYQKDNLCFGCGLDNEDRKNKNKGKDPFEVFSEGEEMERNIQDELNVLYDMKRKEEERNERDINELKIRYETDLVKLKERHKERINKINNTIGKKFRLKEKINLKRVLRYKEIEERNKLLPAMEVLKRNLNIVNENINSLNNVD